MGESLEVWTDGFDGPRDGEYPEWHKVLTEEIVPAADAPWYPDIVEFAVTFNGYEALGGTGPIGSLANSVVSEWRSSGRLPDNLVELRSCLFFEQRRYRHFGEDPDEADMPYMRALIEGIRAHTLDKSSAWDESYAEMLDEWEAVEGEIERRRQAAAEKVASEWVGEFESMTNTYLDLIAQGKWQRGSDDLFNVIGIGRNELRHSAMIAWLLDPLSKHGLGPEFLQAVLDDVFPHDQHDVSGLTTVECEVARGDTRADIIVWGGDFTLIIEVKVDAGEGDRQCDRLYERFSTEPGALFLFLTPKGRSPKTATGEAAEAFQSLNFKHLLELLDGLIDQDTATSPDIGRATTNNYVRTLQKEFT